VKTGPSVKETGDNSTISADPKAFRNLSVSNRARNEMIHWIIGKSLIYCVLPLIIFPLVLTLGLRDFELRAGGRDFENKLVRKFL
jgi:hypothetical protein